MRGDVRRVLRCDLGRSAGRRADQAGERAGDGDVQEARGVREGYKAPVEVKWVDTNKGDKEKPEHRCRLVAKEIKKDMREGLFAATPLLEAKKVVLIVREHAGDVLGVH